MALSDLPKLDAQQKIVSEQFVERIRTQIGSAGPMPFSEYMHRCLYEEELGYYVNGFSKLGKHGDFITAPEISSDFAQCIARQFEQVATDIACASVLEFGGGSGRLAADVLLALSASGQLPETYCILDISPDLRHAQSQLLKSELPPEIYDRVCWLKSLPQNFNGLIIANEVFDAFAVERFRLCNGEAQRLMVDYSDTRLSLCTVSDSDTQFQVSEISSDAGVEFAEGYSSEYCPLLKPWWMSLSEVLNTGAILVCDYGSERKRYYSVQNSSGTLRCFFRHRVHNDPFLYPAVQDITADVDFTAVAIAATDAGFELQGFTPLSQFMLSLGALERHEEQIRSLDQRDRIEATGNLKRVLMNEEMGDRFMVIGFSKNLHAPLNGFSRADWSRLL